jgi:hypothetical protein
MGKQMRAGENIGRTTGSINREVGRYKYTRQRERFRDWVLVSPTKERQNESYLEATVGTERCNAVAWQRRVGERLGRLTLSKHWRVGLARSLKVDHRRTESCSQDDACGSCDLSLGDGSEQGGRNTALSGRTTGRRLPGRCRVHSWPGRRLANHLGRPEVR